MIVKASRGGCGNRDWLEGNADWDSCLVGTIHALSKRPVSYLSAGAGSFRAPQTSLSKTRGAG